MSKHFNYVVFVLIAAVLVVSFSLTYKGGDKITITQSEFINDNIMVNIYDNMEEGTIALQMASINPGYKVEISYDSSKSSTFAPGFSTFNLENMDVEMRTYRKWLQVIWLPYQSIEVDIPEEELIEVPENSNMKFKAEFADKLMEYYTKNQ